METIFVLAAGALQLPAITTAKRMGLRVVAADGNPEAPGLKLADKGYAINILDADACLEVARKENVNGVIHICSEVSMYPMGRINEELHLHGIDSQTAIRSTNKEKMRRALEAASVPSPRSIGAVTGEEAMRAADQINGPLIFKPSRNSGSRGVSRLGKNPDEKNLLRAFEYALCESRDNSVVIEEYVEGSEYSLEILAWDSQVHVLTVTDKETTGAPHFVETGHSEPTREPDDIRKEIEEVAIAGVKALGINWAASHAEIKLSERGPVVIEIGARMGGDFITTELVPRSTGIDMMAGAINIALGHDPDLSPRHEARGSAIRYLTPQPGKVLAIDGVEAAQNSSGVKIVELDIGVGGVVPEITSSLTRVGYVIAEGTDAAGAIANAEAARDAIHIITEARCK